jgi:hypothetical protein
MTSPTRQTAASTGRNEPARFAARGSMAQILPVGSRDKTLSGQTLGQTGAAARNLKRTSRAIGLRAG